MSDFKSVIGAAPRGWGMKQERRTPCYTIDWIDMPTARIWRCSRLEARQGDSFVSHQAA